MVNFTKVKFTKNENSKISPVFNRTFKSSYQ